ncbi:non-ribosomal peptide synthetase, partial [Bacillus wiedmannii]|uniref:non-ribosomal peptide synthetase n=1 Tax=Bacillus wiedmannii TaxID=1890302 RepID=UPI002E242E58|nr:non-ribosomal peptide synthetase [Bacillus wiedmannii]
MVNVYKDIQELSKSRNYWIKKYLNKNLEATTLIQDSLLLKNPTFNKIGIKFTPELTERLLKVSAQNSLSLYVILLSSFKVLLFRLLDEEEITIASPIYRKGIESENNILPISSIIKGDMSFKQCVLSVREAVWEAYSHQGYNIERFIDSKKIERFVKDSIPFSMMNIHGNLGRDINLGFSFQLQGSFLNGEINYNSSIYNETTIRSLVSRFIIVLEQVLYNAELKVSDVNIITDIEKEKLFCEFTGDLLETHHGKTVQEVFEDQVSKTPHSIAIISGEDKMTYLQLNEKANRLARNLRNRGVQPDSIVAIAVEKSTEFVVSVLAVLKAGGAFMPINTSLPSRRIKYMLAQSKAKVVITKDLCFDSLDFVGDIVDIKLGSTYHTDSSNLENLNSYNNLFYVIYTSGTTGNPKGIMLEHKSFLNLIKSGHIENEIDFKNKNVSQFAAVNFDVCYQEIFSTLLNGSTLFLVDEDTKMNVNKFSDFIRENKINTLFLPPAYFNHFFNYIGLQDIFTDLENIILAGEQVILSKEIRSKLKKSSVILHNHYGPSETHVATTYVVKKEGLMERLPIGKPISNTRIFICNKENLVPIGGVGELCIAGEGLARGYLGNPTLTAEKFVENPFIPGEKMYRTGDLARWLPDGNLEFLGRIDHQVKIRGYRIELGEIEHQLLKHEDVEEVVVVDREDEVGEKYLCGYIVANRDISVAELRQTLLTELPDYMIPSYFIQLDKFPLNTNGKIDRKVLPTPDWSSMGHVEYVAPRNEIEEQLAHIWQEILSLNREIGIHENFFELGGHSLRATS